MTLKPTKKYGYNTNATHDWAIFEIGSGEGVIGTSEWIWLDEDWARRITAALNYFDGVGTDEIEKLPSIYANRLV
jgi:hypothetical protein